MRSARVDGMPARSTGGHPLLLPEPAPDDDAAYEPERHEEPAAGEQWTGDLVSPFAAAPFAQPPASAGTASYVAGGQVAPTATTPEVVSMDPSWPENAALASPFSAEVVAHKAEPLGLPRSWPELAGVQREEYQTGPDTATADAFVSDAYGKAYFTTFPQLGDLTIRKATVLSPVHFESLMDHVLSSDQKNFVIDAHGDPSGLHMPLASGTKCSAIKRSLFMLAGIEHIQTLMRLAEESNTIWERASGTDLDKWRRIVETMHSTTWHKMIGDPWPTETPQVATVAAAKSLARSRISALVDALFPGGVSGKQGRVDTLIKKMLQLQAKGIREIQFRACNIGRDSGTLHEFRRFFGADHLCAPDVRSGFGPVSLSISGGGADALAQRRLTQVYDLPSGRFAILIEVSGHTFKATCAAATQAVVGEWVAAHLMAHSRYRKGTFPIHFLETQPRVFALDTEYAAHIRCHSSLWEGAVRAQELEEEEAHRDDEAIGAEPKETVEFGIGGRPDDIETEEEPEAGDAWARALEQGPTVPEQEAESLDPDLAAGKTGTAGSIGDETGGGVYAPALFERQAGGGVTAVDPFPRHPYVLSLEMMNQPFSTCAEVVENNPVTKPMCGAIADVTGNPDLPAFYAHNPIDMLYVASLAKIYPMYVAFELRKRVEEQAQDMIKLGLSTATAGWEGQVFATLDKAWKAKLRAAFPTLPAAMPKFSEIFVLSATGKASFAENDPPLTDADLDFRPPNPTPGNAPISPEFKTPPGKFLDWMRLMLRWSNNEAASNCIRALGYPYINGVLGAAGFFNKSSRVGLWLSGDYLGHDWLKGNGAGQPLSQRWARLQRRNVTNFAGTAFQVARLLTLLAQGRLVDKDSSTAMLRLMTGVAGIGSYIRGGLAGAVPPRAFTAIASKIGCGDEVPPPACGFTHDCAIVRVDRGADPARTMHYVVVALGGHPNQAKADLRTMVVRLHDCVVARHP